MILFGGRISQAVIGEGGDSAEAELTFNEPSEIRAASAAASKAEEQKLLLAQLEKRREALKQQVTVLAATSSPAVDMVFSDMTAQHTQAEPKTPETTFHKRKRSSKSTRRESHDKTQPPKQMDQLPILTTSGKMPFEIGVGEGDPSNRLLPVFLLPEVPNNAKFIRRIPRVDTVEEAAARKEETEELMAMKKALGLCDKDLEELEEELKEQARLKAMGITKEEVIEENDVVRAMTADTKKFPSLPIQKDKVTPPEIRSTPRGLRTRGVRDTNGMRDELVSSLSSYEAFADAVKRDIASIQMSGVPITHPRAARHMKKWGATKMWGAVTRLWKSLLGAVVKRWKWCVTQMKLSERRRAYRNYQGGRLLVNFMRNYMLKYVAIAWVRWNNEIARQLKLKEMYRRKRAAIKIQAHWRARTARMAARALRALLEKKRRVKSVVRIQRWYDCCRMRWAYNAMVRAKQQKAAATLLETRARMLLAKLKVNRVRFERKKVTSALLIQCFWRGRVERLFAMARLVERLEIKSATLIQAVARGRMGRLRVKKIRRHKVETQAALIIQTRARGISARLRCIRLRQERAKERQRLAKAALLVQKCYRGHRDRLKTRIIMNSIRQRRKLEERMAVFVQAAVRGLMTRKRIRMMREERDEALLNEARQFKEIEQDGGLCYQNVETGESVWSPPASGYVKTDGQLMLSTGKVIEDPLTNLTPEEKKARLMEKLCSECEDRNATRKCDQCGDKFCATCYIETHKQGARAQHVWQRLGHIECAECEGVPKAAVRWCVVCDDPFCALHWDDLHKHGARAMHPFCSIDSNGVIDYEASNSIGERQGKYAVGPPSVGGGDDGDGNLHPVAEEVEEDETFHEGGEEGGSVVTGEWAMFVDETNNNYRYNEATGETTYDDPNGVQEEEGGGGGGDEGGGNGEAEWTEFKDDEGNPYWHNTVTGDSTYDSPFT